MLRKTLACMLLALITLFITLPVTFSQPQLSITLDTEKINYHYRQLVSIYGNVTYFDVPVEEGLVALQITFPHGSAGFNATRTVPANATPTDDWEVEIVSVRTLDGNGDPQTIFSKGGNAWFEVEVHNNSVFGNKTVLYTLTLFDSDSTPFKSHMVRATIQAGTSFTDRVRMDLNGYDGGAWVSTGTAKAHASVYTNWPSMGGYPYCPEKSATFTITSTDLQTTTLPESAATPAQTASYYNSYQAAIRLPPDIPLGTHIITASAYYNSFTAYTNTSFEREYEMKGDILYNRKVDIFDIVAAASAYNTKGGLPRWNPEADLPLPTPNGKVDIFDIVAVSSNYGKTY